MYITATDSITSWWIYAMMSLFLWYRNEKYDRALSVFLFTLGLTQLIDYGIYSSVNPKQSGRALFITLWLQCLVLAIGVFLFVKHEKDKGNPSITENIVQIISGWNLFLFAIVFVIALITSFTSSDSFSGNVNEFGNIIWTRDGGNILGKYGILYVIGIFLPLFLIFAYYLWADIGIALIILYGALSACYVFINYQPSSFIHTWSYFSIGIVFLAWLSGIISPAEITIKR